MNYLFLLNAALLLVIGVYLHYQNKENLSLQLLVFNLGLAVWNICAFLNSQIPGVLDADIVAKTQIAASVVFNNAIYFFCNSYPQGEKNKGVPIKLFVGMVLVLAIFFTDFVTSAEYTGVEIIYKDHSFGWPVYSAYMLGIGILALTTLFLKYQRFPDYRNNIKYIFTGILIFAIIILSCSMILPLFGVYDFLILGRLSPIIPALVFAYVIAKHDFMDISVIINRKVAWVITFGFVIVSYYAIYTLVDFQTPAGFILMLMLTLFWSVIAAPFQQFLLTSARRKFIRNWYEPDDVISQIAEQLTVEKDRAEIFSILVRVLDDVFQLEKITLILAIKNKDDQISHYEVITRSGQYQERAELENTALLEEFQTQTRPGYLDDYGEETRRYLVKQGFRLNKSCLVVPFSSPEYLEGVVIMGERSDQSPFYERDIRFMMRLVNYIAAILYRLTPFEKLETLYFENKERLHEAEIQLIRAQKIEAIVHATRQCHHEIRTPLNIIKLGIGRINTLEDLKSYKKYADEEVSRALEIVDETLTITDVNKVGEDRTSHFDINDVVKRSIRIVDLERYRLSLDFENLSEVKGSFSDMQVVISNLIHNALDAMPDGGTLTIRTYPTDQSVIIEVEDTGSGIEESLRSRVWEPYFSGKETEVGNSTAGRGWGLTIVNRIITEHKGSINFTSTVGVGTTFTIILPASA